VAFRTRRERDLFAAEIDAAFGTASASLAGAVAKATKEALVSAKGAFGKLKLDAVKDRDRAKAFGQGRDVLAKAVNDAGSAVAGAVDTVKQIEEAKKKVAVLVVEIEAVTVDRKIALEVADTLWAIEKFRADTINNLVGGKLPINALAVKDELLRILRAAKSAKTQTAAGGSGGKKGAAAGGGKSDSAVAMGAETGDSGRRRLSAVEFLGLAGKPVEGLAPPPAAAPIIPVDREPLAGKLKPSDIRPAAMVAEVQSSASEKTAGGERKRTETTAKSTDAVDGDAGKIANAIKHVQEYAVPMDAPLGAAAKPKNARDVLDQPRYLRIAGQLTQQRAEGLLHILLLFPVCLEMRRPLRLGLVVGAQRDLLLLNLLQIGLKFGDVEEIACSQGPGERANPEHDLDRERPGADVVEVA